MIKNFISFKSNSNLLTLILFFFPLMLISCSQKDENKTDEKKVINKPEIIKHISENIILDSNNSSCSFFTIDNIGKPVVSWISQNEFNEFEFYYSTLSEENRFLERKTVKGSNQIKPNGENLPKIIFRNNGDVVAFWGIGNPNPQNKYSGLILYSISKDNGNTWSTPEKISNDTLSIDQRYFSVTNLPNGNIGAIWLDNRYITSENGSSLFYAELDSTGKFNGEKIIAENVCECCRTNFTVSKNGMYNITYRDIFRDSIRDIAYINSSDFGKTFSSPVRIHSDNWVINGCPHTGPDVSVSGENINFIWHTMGTGKGVFYCNTTDNGKNFSSPVNLTNNPTAKHQQILSLKDKIDLFIWDESSLNSGNKNNQILLSIKNGNEFSKPILISDENKSASFPVFIKLNENLILISYTQSLKLSSESNHSNHSHTGNSNEYSEVVYKFVEFNH